MEKSSPEALVAQLRQRQAAVAQTVDELKEQLSPAALAEAGKEKLSEAARSVVTSPDGRPKPWVLVLVSVVLALVVAGVTIRTAKRLAK
jgi:hypothetical protein